MKRYKVIPAALVLLIVAMLTALGGGCSSKDESNQMAEDTIKADGIYTGTALRGETQCYPDGDCFFCTANDEVQLERREGQITIRATGPSLTMTPCSQSGNVTYTLKGDTETSLSDWQRFTITDCNSGSFPGGGAGSIEYDTITASFSCDLTGGGRITDTVEWNGVTLKKQS